MTKIVSFLSFLTSGQLGPIRTGLTAGEVAKLMGAPAAWIDNGTLPFPNYWCYGKLEINFSASDRLHTESGMRVPTVDWFQIEYADQLDGDCEIVETGGGVERTYSSDGHGYSNGFGTALVMTLDGLSGDSTPVDFLVALAACPSASVAVGRTLETSSYRVHILNGPVDIIFDIDDDEDDESVRLARTDSEVARIVERAHLDSIYSYREPATFHAPNSLRERRLYTPSAFLAAVRT